ncbi:hypothetical protein N7468_010625 [Penicillium chermesinum]|uniref:Uncharacterized protein n=1 Tax=Penicillium chermesinum TaxID=63820 RepID=A0A9W9N820_9EURO|nr:uncharacterized protein N7468_010625 [Penicillium chermesinum]KAJ5214946.1 hypothetical protein N7468_010625 [Penicillium chermesinum]
MDLKLLADGARDYQPLANAHQRKPHSCTPRLSLLGSALTPLFSKQRPKWLPSPGIPPSHITVQLPVEPYHLQLASRMLSARGKSTMR